MTLSTSDHIEHLRAAAGIAGMSVPQFVVADEHHIVFRRMRFHYLDWGRPGKRPILFLHGGGLTAHTWDLVCLAVLRQNHIRLA